MAARSSGLRRSPFVALYTPAAGWLLAIDGARSSGWAVYFAGKLLSSGTVDLHSHDIDAVVELALGGPDRDKARMRSTVMVIEKPWNSGHMSAAVGLGGAIGVWRRQWVLAGGSERRIERVHAMTWRARILGAARGLTREQWKALAVARARALFPGAVNSDDQAEAILIGLWASFSARVLSRFPKSVREAA
jgi:hypothetical protein